MDNNLCMSIKSKKEVNIRCPNKKKLNCDFCGKHLVNPIIFKAHEEDNKEKENIPNVNELFFLVQENKTLSVNIIRKCIRGSYLNSFINSKLSKSNLIIKLKEHIIKERHYINNEYNIIKIQSFVRMFLKKYRYMCANEVDVLTMNSKMEIENPYFYRFYNRQNGKYYGYDIRLLNDLINSNYQSCPYTFRKFDESEIDNINQYIEKLKRLNIKVKVEKELSEEEIMENKVKDLFYKINMLDNYTNHKWFMNLTQLELIKLYISAEDIWNYRSLLNEESKYKIIQNNYIFNIPVMMIRKVKSISRLRDILIYTFDIMVSSGIDINEKKLGAILVLSALVEISPDAANALPHLIQV